MSRVPVSRTFAAWLFLAPALILAPAVLPRAPLLRVVTLPAAMFSAPVKVLVVAVRLSTPLSNLALA